MNDSNLNPFINSDYLWLNCLDSAKTVCKSLIFFNVFISSWQHIDFDPCRHLSRVYMQPEGFTFLFIFWILNFVYWFLEQHYVCELDINELKHKGNVKTQVLYLTISYVYFNMHKPYHVYSDFMWLRPEFKWQKVSLPTYSFSLFEFDY